MTGNDLIEWIDTYQLNQSDAASILGVSRQTLFTERQKEGQEINPKVAEDAIKFALAKAQNDMAAASGNLNNLINDLFIIQAGG